MGPKRSTMPARAPRGGRPQPGDCRDHRPANNTIVWLWGVMARSTLPTQPQRLNADNGQLDFALGEEALRARCCRPVHLRHRDSR